MKLYTCAMTSPETAVSALIKDRVFEKSGIFTLEIGKRLSDPLVRASAKGHQLILVLCYDDFVKNLDVLNTWPRHVLLFASAIQCARLSSANHTDALIDGSDPQPIHRFIPFKASSFNPKNQIPTDDVVIVEEFLHRFIENTRAGSVLNGLFSEIYHMGNASQQKSIKEQLCRWFVESGDKGLLTTIVNDIVPASRRARTIEACTTSPDLLKVLAEIKKVKDAGKAPNYDSIKRRFPELDLYEVRYLLNLYSKIVIPRELQGRTLAEIYWSRERNAQKLEVKTVIEDVKAKRPVVKRKK